jgi:TonB-dependent SusC/RagA subfamily outer membrane receptor
MIRALLYVTAFLLSIGCSSAQTPLTKSRTSSNYTYAYKLTDKEAHDIVLHSKADVLKLLSHLPVDSFVNTGNIRNAKALSYGNYLLINASGNQLEHQFWPVSNVSVSFIGNSTNLRLIVRDLKGRQIDNAVVKTSNKILTFNSGLKVYQGSFTKKDPVISVTYDGVTSFVKYEVSRRQAKTSMFKRLFKPKKDKEVENTIFNGSLVFNKPVYRPLDTVKFKAYLLTNKGKPIRNIPLKIFLSDGNKAERALKTLTPYRDGAYEGSFVLHDSLQLKLDQNYEVVIKAYKEGKWHNRFVRSIRLEDYLLKDNHISIRTDRSNYFPGQAVSIFVTAKDANDLPIADGRLEILVKTGYSYNRYASHLFVKDTLWTVKQQLDPIGETQIVIPEGAFPRADLSATIFVKLLNSNNEKLETSSSISFTGESSQLKLYYKKDSVQLDLQTNDKSVSDAVILYKLPLRSNNVIDSIKAILPICLPIDESVSLYRVKTSTGKIYSAPVYVLAPGVRPLVSRKADSVRVAVDNVLNIPFWYTIIGGNQVLSSGYARKLDTAIFIKNNKTTTTAFVNYIWAGDTGGITASEVFNGNKLNVSLGFPPIVYPGQVVDMEVQVTDVENKPSAFTDLTASAYSSKFGESRESILPVFKGVSKPMKDFFTPWSLNANVRGQNRLDWDRWHKVLELDTIAFYQFVQAKDLVVFTEKTSDSLAIAVPFVVANGEIQPAHIVYIDDEPVYFSQADQLKRYAFTLKPGQHTIRLRTLKNEVSYTANFSAGIRTVFSIAADVANSKAKVTPVTSFLTVSEIKVLQNKLLRVRNDFGENLSLITDRQKTLLLYPLSDTFNIKNLLIGPVFSDSLKFSSGPLLKTFKRENGLLYTFSPAEVKRQPIHIISTGYLDPRKGDESSDYGQNPLSTAAIDSIWNDYLNLRSKNHSIFPVPELKGTTTGRLLIALDQSILKQKIYLKNVVVFKNADANYRRIIHGNAGLDMVLEPSAYRLLFLFKDNSYFVAENLVVQANGDNHYSLKDIQVNQADQSSITLDNEIKSSGRKTLPSYKDDTPSFLMEDDDQVHVLDKDQRQVRMSGTVQDKKTKELMTVGTISLKIGDSFKVIANVNIDGAFDVLVPKDSKLRFWFLGYKNVDIRVRPAKDLVITLEEGVRKGKYTVVEDHMVYNFGAPGMLGEVNIRGLSSITHTGSGNQPLIILDGKIFNGKLSDIDQASISSIQVMKDAEANSIYGAAAANGVIVVRTVAVLPADEQEGVDPYYQSLRKNFSDYAIWQPTLMTDENGKARFKVKFPDDVTSWTTRILAINGRQQAGYFKTEIKSFKTLSANLVSPLFALKGDTMKVIGKLMNYNGSQEQVERKFIFNDEESLSSTVSFKNVHLDTITVVAPISNADSLHFKYSMLQANGYFDGELRKIPVLAVGTIETQGHFEVLKSDTTVSYAFNPKMGPVSIRAEASIFPALLEEIERLKEYEYLCNEQLASKLKGILLEKNIRKLLGQDFKGEKAIVTLIEKLNLNMSDKGLWGWWQDSPEESWISLHVVEALTWAEAQGYKVAINKVAVAKYIDSQISTKSPADLFFALKLLSVLKFKSNDQAWIHYFERMSQDDNKRKEKVAQTLRLMQLKQKAGMPIDVRLLLSLKRQTIFGNIYWGEQNDTFWDNSVQNTLLAYQIIKEDGGHNNLLKLIQGYFMEQRKDGQWRNTYESSLILETILPDLLKEKQADTASLILNSNEHISSFPFSKTITTSQLNIKKTGSAAIYFTAYQQLNNTSPEKVSKNFKVSTSLSQDGKVVGSLKPGVTATIKVEVEVSADADYVMIEIPIPAGCSYEKKSQTYGGVETHREYFKHKTSVFCSKMKKGRYNFDVQLMPRYSGNYTLNPAKAEMMYFPAVYGREGLRKVTIQ